MRYSAVIFDLFGTLVEFSSGGHDRANAQIAKSLNAPALEFSRMIWGTYVNRCIGVYDSIEENVLDVCSRLGIQANMEQITQATRPHYEFTANALIPKPDVLEALDMLKNSGFLLGLISNCAPTVPLLFPQSPLAPYIDVPIFSCEEGINKPSPRIYQLTCERLKVRPEECLYVGDGSSEELTGAAAVGMLPILKRADLIDVHDPHRPEVENWQERVIDKIEEVCEILSELA